MFSVRLYFWFGLAVKLAGAWFVYEVHQRGILNGDLPSIYQQAEVLRDLFRRDFYVGLSAFFHEWNPAEARRLASAFYPRYLLVDLQTYTLTRLVFLCGLPFGGSALGSALAFSGAAYLGWFLFVRRLLGLFPRERNFLAFVCLCLPCVWFWGSGLTKDVALFGLCGGVLAQVFSPLRPTGRGAKPLFGWAAAAACLVLVYFLRPFFGYLFLALTAALVSERFLQTVPHRFLRNGLRLWGWSLLAAFFLVFSPFKADVLLAHFHTLRNYAAYETLQDVAPEETRLSPKAYAVLEQKTSFFRLGEFEQGWQGIAQKIPQGLEAAALRPYPTEVRRPLLWFVFFENALHLLCAVYFLYQNTRRGWRSRGTGWVLVVFSLFYLTIVGLSVPFWGSVARYRSLVVPLGLVGLKMLGR